jgi:hypothetical protein
MAGSNPKLENETMRFQSHPSLPALRIAAVTMLAALGSAVGCDVEDELSTEELELLAADLDDESALDLTSEPGEGEPYVGVGDRDRIDALTADSDPLGYGFLPWHSDETAGSSTCPANQIVTGFDCDGSYCDNVKLECHGYGGTVSGHQPWSAWFDHNGKSNHVCPAGTKITGIDCWGDYCDNISIRCTSAPGLDTARCAWSSWYSEDNASPFYAAGGDAIQGIWCSGTHCDNKSFYVCET